MASRRAAGVRPAHSSRPPQVARVGTCFPTSQTIQWPCQHEISTPEDDFRCVLGSLSGCDCRCRKGPCAREWVGDAHSPGMYRTKALATLLRIPVCEIVTPQ